MDHQNELEKRFEAAFETSPIGIALVSTEGKWLKVNPSICEIVGYSASELMSKTFQDITFEEDLEKDLDKVKQVLEGVIDNYQMEKRYIRKNGSVVWALLSVSLVRSNHGKPLYFVSQIVDINNQKNYEKNIEMKVKELEKINNLMSGREVKMIELKRENEQLRSQLHTLQK